MMEVMTETRSAHWNRYLCLCYNHWIDTSAGELLVPNRIICQVVSGVVIPETRRTH